MRAGTDCTLMLPCNLLYILGGFLCLLVGLLVGMFVCCGLHACSVGRCVGFVGWSWGVARLFGCLMLFDVVCLLVWCD